MIYQLQLVYKNGDITMIQHKYNSLQEAEKEFEFVKNDFELREGDFFRLCDEKSEHFINNYAAQT